MKINKLKPPFSPEWQMRTHRLPICLHTTAPTLAKAGFLRGMAWPLDVNKKGCVCASPFLEGVASVGRGGVSAGELWASLGWRVCLPDGISSVSRSLHFCSVDVSLFRLPVTTQAVLSPQNHLLGHLLGPETLPRSQWQEGGSELKLAALRCLRLPRSHPSPALGRGFFQETGDGLWGGLFFLFCSPGMSNTSSRIHPLSQEKKKKSSTDM